MRRFLSLWFLLLPALAQVRAVATTPVLADLVAQVGGERVRVVSLVPPGSDPHTYEPRPSAALALEGAQVLFANGLGLEAYLPRLEALLPKGARVVRLAEGQPNLICGLLGLREKGVHLHGDCDPHLWLDPAYALRYAERIAGVLGELDPGGGAFYQSRLSVFREEVLKEDRALEACLKGKGLRVATNHLSLLYFARRYGVEIVGTLMDAHARETGPRTRLALLKEAERGLDLFLSEPQFPRARAGALAKELGVPLVVVYTDALDDRVPTYLDLLRHNRKTLCEAVQKIGR
ncbi:ABC-type metal ion transport system, periplasmic component/surface adhesin (plasmid) [Thermus oshimai JL-2]|uniref:ABC-type metal ion transport system, periplasmic component/surface adhesin n=1 Tax=Thermus oshimai JL-2 TaxID=751945 RepID=K7R248_THEOS|nr:metal ABC transporter substrate-binding protein [Thermus oshimai]AFV77365.1 ABC-type metal ion transport system, periplasmic component/surface adhesin [Thermus oshimai JL-2]